MYPLNKIFRRNLNKTLLKPMIIAELSGNHSGKIENALKLVDKAADAGADAVKLQTYTAETMTLNIKRDEFMIDNPDSIWYGQSLFELYENSKTPYEWHEEIFNYANKLGLLAFSSPFDNNAVDFLESLNVPCYKIASYENIDHDLIKKVSSTGKPVIISTGMASKDELLESVDVARSNGCKDLILLKCTSSYPAIESEINLLSIPYMRELFNCNVGLSDHTVGNVAATSSIALGACVIEKHLTLDNSDDGSDSQFSSNPENFKCMVRDVHAAYESLGTIHFGPTQSEKKSIEKRRSLFVIKDINKGEVLSSENVKSIRPGFGLKPKYLSKVIGSKALRNIEKGTPLSWELIDEAQG